MGGAALPLPGEHEEVVDVHTHFIPPFFLDEGNQHRTWRVSIHHRDGLPWIQHDEGYGYPVQETFFRSDAKSTDMKQRGIDRAILSVAPTLFFYWIDPSETKSFSRRANDALAEFCADSNGRFEGLATLPMQDPEKAAGELRRAADVIGLRGAEIGTSVEGVPLDDPRFVPLWEAADDLDVPLMLHPYYVGPKQGYEDYYLTNTFVNPLDTALAAARLIHCGALERFPRLKFLLVHAGGFLPYQIGRFDHGWAVRDEPKAHLDRRPSEMLERFYFDTITHHDSALSWLIDLVGPDHVVFGTDLPFDMADGDGVERVRRVVEAAERAAILNRNAADLFNLKART